MHSVGSEPVSNARKLRLTVWLMLSALGTGCGASEAFVSFPPVSNSARAMVLAIEVDGELQVRAVELGANTAGLRWSSIQRELRMTAFIYDSTLSELGLESGVVPAVTADVCGAQAIGGEVDRLEWRWTPNVDPRSVSWRSGAELSAVVAAFRIQGACPCLNWTVVRDEVVPMRSPSARASHPNGQALLWDRGDGLPGDTVYSVARDRVETVRLMAPVPTNVRAAYADAAGELWLGDHNRVWQGRLETPFRRVGTFEMSGGVRDIAGDGMPGGERYIATDFGWLARVSPGPVEVYRQDNQTVSGTGQEARLAWLGPNEVVFSQPQTLTVFHYRDGEIAAVADVPIEGDGIIDFVTVQGRAVGVSKFGPIYEFNGEEVVELGLPDLGEPSDAVEFGQGFIHVGESGYFQEYQPDFGFCPPQYFADAPPLQGVVLAGEQVVVHAPAPGNQVRLLVIEPSD